MSEDRPENQVENKEKILVGDHEIRSEGNLWEYSESDDYTPEQEAHSHKIDEALENIKNGKDLREFIWLLVRGINMDFFEEQCVAEYVEGAYGVLEGTPDAVLERERPDWKMVGDLFLRAFYHS